MNITLTVDELKSYETKLLEHFGKALEEVGTIEKVVPDNFSHRDFEKGSKLRMLLSQTLIQEYLKKIPPPRLIPQI